MRLTESEDLTKLTGKPDHHYDLFDGAFDWCNIPPSEVTQTDSSFNLKLLNTFGNYVISISIHYKRYGCTDKMDDFVSALRYRPTMSESEKNKHIKRYLANEFGYYEFLSDTYRVVDANLIMRFGNADVFYSLFN